MKFGKSLQAAMDPQHPENYIPYKALKKVLHDESLSPQERFDKFFTVLTESMNEVVKFSKSMCECATHRAQASHAQMDLEDMRSSARDALFFIDLNLTGCRKILKKYTKKCTGDFHPETDETALAEARHILLHLQEELERDMASAENLGKSTAQPQPSEHWAHTLLRYSFMTV